MASLNDALILERLFEYLEYERIAKRLQYGDYGLWMDWDYRGLIEDPYSYLSQDEEQLLKISLQKASPYLFEQLQQNQLYRHGRLTHFYKGYLYYRVGIMMQKDSLCLLNQITTTK